MPWETLPDRAAAYRRRAEESRRKAEASADEQTRKSHLQMADTWERMAAYEDEHKPLSGAGDLPFTCRACQANFSVHRAIIGQRKEVTCPECGATHPLSELQLKDLDPSRTDISRQDKR